MHREVIDKTGLTGNYDFNLEWAPDSVSTGGSQESGLSLFTAVQEQLGLKFEPHVSPVSILVIDDIEPPSEN